MDNSKYRLQKVLQSAITLVKNRDGDIYTEDGEFATCDISDIIELEEALVTLLNLPYDDLSEGIDEGLSKYIEGLS